jgi:hypothetical protein
MEHRKIIYYQIFCAGDDEVIFEHDINEDEDTFTGQGMLNTVLNIFA